MTKLYLAYGSNMNKAQMARRCPNAKPLRAIIIDDARLVFRGVADIEFCQGASVPVVLWSITAACERELDKYEGVAAGVYEKREIPLDNGETALTYVMCKPGIAPPTRDYYERIKQGYNDFGLDLEPLEVALKHSHVKQQHSAETRRRLARNIASGNTQVARRPMHIPLDRVDPNLAGTGNTTTTGGRIAGTNVHSAACQHGWYSHCPEGCQSEQPELPLLALPKPDPRYDGYNWSERAKAGTAKGKRVVYETRDDRGPWVDKRQRKNKFERRTKHKNLSDYLRDKGYSGENH